MSRKVDIGKANESVDAERILAALSGAGAAAALVTFLLWRYEAGDAGLMGLVSIGCALATVALAVGSMLMRRREGVPVLVLATLLVAACVLAAWLYEISKILETT